MHRFTTEVAAAACWLDASRAVSIASCSWPDCIYSEENAFTDEYVVENRKRGAISNRVIKTIRLRLCITKPDGGSWNFGHCH